MPERKTVSIPRACELVGVSRRTIYNWLAGGKVEYVRTAGGSVGFLPTRSGASPAEHSRRHPASSGIIGFAAVPETPAPTRPSRPVESRARVGSLPAVPSTEQSLGVILANAELLESRLTDETQRARASQIVAGAVGAIATVQSLRRVVAPENDRGSGLSPSAG